MQLMSCTYLIVGYVLKMPYIFDGFLNNPKNQRLIQLVGYMNEGSGLKKWHVIINIVMLSFAITFAEIYFEAERIN